jgi:1-acyl-sn-glycerol-3-phosphate acyltransferase
MAKTGPPRPWVYWTVKYVLFICYKIFFRFRYSGAEHVPSDKDPRGVILAPNHASFLDPPILGISLGRPVTFLAKEYLFRAFFVGWILRSVGAFPIRTEADDFRSIRDLIRKLKEGACIVVFPEGTRSPDGELREGESGVGFLAMKSKAAVVPVYIDGTFEAFPKGVKMFRCRPVRTFYGTPFVPAEDETILKAQDPYAAVSARIMEEIKFIRAKTRQSS